MERRQIGFVHLKGGVGASLLTAAYAHHWALHEGPALIIDVQGTITDIFSTSEHATQTGHSTWRYKVTSNSAVTIARQTSPIHKTIDEQVEQLATEGTNIGAVLIDTATTEWHRLRRLLNFPIATTTGSITARRYDDELRELAGTTLTVETFARKPSSPGIVRFPASPDWDAAAANGMLSPTQLGDTSTSAALLRLHQQIRAALPIGHRNGRRLDIRINPTLASLVSDIADLDSHICTLASRFDEASFSPSQNTTHNTVRWRPVIEQPTYATIDALARRLGSDVSHTIRALLDVS